MNLDLRLLLPAVSAWAVSAWLARSPASALGAAAVAGAVLGALCIAISLGARLRSDRRAASLVAAVALTGVSVCAVCACALGSRLIERAGPVESLAADRAVVHASGTVITQPRVLSADRHGVTQVMFVLRVEHVQARGRSSAATTPVLVFADAAWADVPWRSSVQVGGRLAEPRSADGHVERYGDVVAVLTPFTEPVVADPPGVLFRAADITRERLRLAVGPLPADARGLIPGLVIGDTSLTPPELTDAMLDTGMSHLSAVSGSNVAIVLGAVVLVCRFLGVPRRWRAPLAMLALVGFVLLCRPEPSVLRAAVMGVVGLAGLSAARRAATVPALAAAVMVLLCVDPGLARSYGFALSTLATLGLVMFARPWGDAIARRLPRRAALVGDAVAIPLAAQVVCAPVIVLLQGNIAVIAVLANLLAAPMVAITTVTGIAAAVAATVWVPAGMLVAWIGALPAVWIGAVARGCAKAPWGQLGWIDGPPGAWLLTALTVLVLLTGPWLRYQMARHPVVVVSVIGLSGAALVPLTVVPAGSAGWPPRGWTVVACDVGQGDAFVVSTGPASAVVIDVGPEPDIVVGCLQDLQIDRVDALILSHFHHDHVGGLRGLLETTDVAAAYVSPVREPSGEADRTLAMLAEAGVSAYPVAAGDELHWGHVSTRVVWPRDALPAGGGSTANNGSVVLDLTAGRTRILFTGDIEQESASHVRRAVRGIRFDVLKVAHHGSADQDEQLIAGSGARLALIGVGENTFGHPTSSALRLLRRAGMIVRRTDVDGYIAVVHRGSELSVVTERGG